MWKTVKLGDLLEVQNGYAFNSKQFSSEGEVPLIRIRDLKAGVSTQTRYTGEYEDKYIVKKGDLLIGMDGEFRCYEWKGVDALLNQRVCRLQNFKGDLLKRYLLYVINNQLKEIEDVTGFTTVKHLSSTTIKKINLPLPPLAEQQRIVAKLDAAFAEIDGIIGQTEKKIHHAKLLMQKTIDESIKGESSDMLKVKLDEFCDIKHGFAFDGKSFSVSDDESKPIVLTPGNFAENGTTKFNDKNTKRLQIEYDKKLLFSSDDLVVVMTDLSSKMLLLGKPAFVKQSNILHNQRIGLVKNNEQMIVNDYLYFYFRTTNYLNEIKKTASGTMVRHTAPKRILRNTITAPKSLSEQRAISTKITMSLSKSENLIDIYKTKVSNLLSLKAAILAQELTPPSGSEAA